jgi:hypothetical protein
MVLTKSNMELPFCGPNFIPRDFLNLAVFTSLLSCNCCEVQGTREDVVAKIGKAIHFTHIGFCPALQDSASFVLLNFPL